MENTNKPSQISEMLLDKIASDDPKWIDEGLCTTSDVDPFNPADAEKMLALCAKCPVSKECAAYRETKNVSNGVWSGLNLNEG